MRTRNTLIFVALLLLAAATAGLVAGPRLSNAPERTTTSASTNSASANSASTTLSDLISGNFPSASDKQGTGGVTVTVTNLQVISVQTESDGDWHVAVTDGVVSVFITEITPSYQAAIGQPQAGSVIEETGIAYCDTNHETESWHGNTCWEIHPVTSWHLVGAGGRGASTTTSSNAGLQVTVSYAADPIQRGSDQTITVQLRDSDGAVANASVSVEVDYASGYTSHTFSCTTSSSGSCSVTWTIGSTSTPGTFEVTLAVEGQSFHSSFTVTS